MTPLAPLVTAFFRKHLASEKGVSKNTIVSYSYAFKFLCRYVSRRVGKAPSALCLEDFDARIVRDFLEHLERECGNTPRTRNLRLTAIRSFMKYAQYEAPSALDQARQSRYLAMSESIQEACLSPCDGGIPVRSTHCKQPETSARLPYGWVTPA